MSRLFNSGVSPILDLSEVTSTNEAEGAVDGGDLDVLVVLLVVQVFGRPVSACETRGDIQEPSTIRQVVLHQVGPGIAVGA